MIATEMVDINEIIDNIQWSLDDKIKLAGAVINRNLEVEHILFSKKNLRSIIYNLISNSIKFKGTKPPVINIRTIRDGNNVTLSVEDNGRGLSKYDVTKIFDLYGRLHHDIEGQGIGLYLAKKMIDATDGNITVESELDKGTKINVYFKTEGDASVPVSLIK